MTKATQALLTTLTIEHKRLQDKLDRRAMGQVKTDSPERNARIVGMRDGVALAIEHVRASA